MTRYRKTFLARMDNQGRLTIPKPVRIVMGIKHSSLVDAWIKSPLGNGPKYFTAWVDCQGRITVPKRIRTRLGLAHDDILDCEVELIPKEVQL